VTLLAWVRIEIDEPSDRDAFEHIPLALEAALGVSRRLLAEGEEMKLLVFSKDEFQRLLHPVNVVAQTTDASQPERVVGQFVFRAYNKQVLDADAEADDASDNVGDSDLRPG